MLRVVILTVLPSQLVFATPQAASTPWQNSSLIKTSTVNEWCRQCPDWNQTYYSFKREMVRCSSAKHIRHWMSR